MWIVILIVLAAASTAGLLLYSQGEAEEETFLEPEQEKQFLDRDLL